MAKDKKPQKPNNVVNLADSRCVCCSKKAMRSSFCDEHFVWFKQGLVNRQGERPKDFDKKYQAFLRKQAA